MNPVSFAVQVLVPLPEKTRPIGPGFFWQINKDLNNQFRQSGGLSGGVVPDGATLVFAKQKRKQVLVPLPDYLTALWAGFFLADKQGLE